LLAVELLAGVMSEPIAELEAVVETPGISSSAILTCTSVSLIINTRPFGETISLFLE